VETRWLSTGRGASSSPPPVLLRRPSHIALSCANAYLLPCPSRRRVGVEDAGDIEPVRTDAPELRAPP